MVPTLVHSFRSQGTVLPRQLKLLIVVLFLVSSITLLTTFEGIFEWEGKIEWEGQDRNVFGKSEKKQETNIHDERDAVSDLTGETDEFSFNIIFDYKRSQCGGKKCFLRVKEDANLLYNNTGYLIRHNISNDKNNIDHQRYWDLAMNLEKDYNVSTLVIAHPPQVLPINKTFTQNLFVEASKLKGKGRKFNPDKALIVQKVKVAPEPNIKWQEIYDKKRILDYPWILEHLTKFVELNIKGREIFCHNLFSSLNTTREFLSNPKYKCLHYDFQFIMDYKGIFHHIDLDRCSEGKSSKQRKEAIAVFLDNFALAFRRTFQSMNVSCSLMNET